jgi:hypothetical protein
LGALGLLALALVARTRGWVVVSTANFVASGNDADSLLMAIGFASERPTVMAVARLQDIGRNLLWQQRKPPRR